MARSGQVRQRLAEVTGLGVRALDDAQRSLRAAGLAPMGKGGRDLAFGAYHETDMANLVLGLGASLLSDAAEAAEALGSMVHRQTTPPDVKTPTLPG